MQDDLCVLCLCACASDPSPWLGTSVGVRGTYAKWPLMAFWVSLKLAWAWRARIMGPPQCGWMQAMPLLQVLSPQGLPVSDPCRTGVTFCTAQHSKQIRGTIAGWNASAKANPSRGLFWKIVVKPSKTRVLTWQDLVHVLLRCRNLAFTWLCGLHTLIKCCQVRWCWQMRLLAFWLGTLANESGGSLDWY